MKYGLLGPLLLEVDGKAVVLSSGRRRTLLAALLVRTNQVVSADTLIRQVWDEDPPANARAALQTHVTRLRSTLTDQGAPGDAIVTRPPGYLIRVEPPEAVDIVQFERLLESARQAATRDDLATQSRYLAEALALWRGPALADIESEALRHEVAVRLSERRLGALEERVAADLRLGRHAAVVAELRTLTARHPLRERFWAQLMLALAGAGQQAAALAAHAEIRGRLVRELGVEPGIDIQNAHQQVLRQERAVGGGEAGATPPPAQLPSGTAAFTGRAAYLDSLDAIRRDAVHQPATGVPITAITGSAGVGKTALAVHWAHRVRDHFPDGQLYLNLRGYASALPVRPADALAQFLRALGVPADRIPADPDEAASLYRTTVAGKRMLVVLDNAATADQVRPLIPGNSACFVLVTSRDRLAGLTARESAHRLALDTLDPAEARTLLVRMIGADRVDAEPDAAAELAAACAYLPLALRIVAANLADQPDRRLAELVPALRAADRLAAMEIDGDEQSAVRGAFRLSDAALDPAARRLFYLLGLVPGPDFTPAAAAAIADIPLRQAELLLDLLTSAHLAQPTTPGRYAFHDLLRVYAAEQARAEYGDAEAEAAIERLLDWYLRLTDAAAAVLYAKTIRVQLPADRPPTRFRDSVQALAWLDAERFNLVVAIRYAAEHGPYRQAWMLADILRGYYNLGRSQVDWMATAEAGLLAAGHADDRRGLAAAQFSLAVARVRFGNSEQALADLDQALAWAAQAGWHEGEAAALGMLGNTHRQLGNPETAASYMTRSVELFESIDKPASHAAALSNLGLLLRDQGRLHEAFERQTKALAVYRLAGAPYGESLTLANLGEVCHDLGRTEEALAHLTDALRLHSALGDQGGEAETRRILATVYRDSGQPAEALAHGQAALDFARDAGDRRNEATAAQTVATIHQAAGRWQEAADLYREILTLTPDVSDRYPAVEAQTGLALACHRLGHTAEAITHAEAAIKAADEHGFQRLGRRAEEALALIGREQ